MLLMKPIAGIGRLGLELVECQKNETYTDLPQEIFGKYVFWTKRFKIFV